MSRGKRRHTIVGRTMEMAVLSAALVSPDPELVAIYGRRRVGKTYLVREFFRSNLIFELTGLHGEPLNRQLENFANTLRQSAASTTPLRPRSWLEAFEQLKLHVQDAATKDNKHGKLVLFFDELPWLATRRSGFLAAMEAFWNTFASRRDDVLMVICGSATSWMIRKVIGSRGGLHNRTTRNIQLAPFTLSETRDYFVHRRVNLDDFQTVQLYMAIGGIPQYLNSVANGQSAAQNIDRICFTPQGALANEFEHLYAALFENHETHEKIIRALGAAGRGLNRNALLKQADIESGGGATTALRELIQCGFIQMRPPHGKQLKHSIYRLCDEFSLFYLNWIETNRTTGSDVWLRKASTRRYSTWCGYAFETLCLKHVQQIKAALGIHNVETTESPWQYYAQSADDEGAQIDLLIDRRDHCTNICEMKFSEQPFVITKRYAADLERKLRVFRQRTATRNTIFLTLVTASGLTMNEHAKKLVSSQVKLADLFRQV